MQIGKRLCLIVCKQHIDLLVIRLRFVGDGVKCRNSANSVRVKEPNADMQRGDVAVLINGSAPCQFVELAVVAQLQRAHTRIFRQSKTLSAVTVGK